MCTEILGPLLTKCDLIMTLDPSDLATVRLPIIANPEKNLYYYNLAVFNEPVPASAWIGFTSFEEPWRKSIMPGHYEDTTLGAWVSIASSALKWPPWFPPNCSGID